MFVVGIFLLCGLCVYKADATMMCLDCPPSRTPGQCTHMSRCHPDQMCAKEVHEIGGEYWYVFGCIVRKACIPMPVVVGRRTVHLDQHSLRCGECCEHSAKCSNDLCSAFNPTSSPPPSTTTTTTTTRTTTLGAFNPPSSPPPSPTTTTTATRTTPLSTTITHAPLASVGDPNCHDKEDDGIACSYLDLYNVCSTNSTLATLIAREKCPKHCGICKSFVPSKPVTSPHSGVCADFEQDGIQCGLLDLVHVCTDRSNLSYVLSHLKCAKHCGFCPPRGGIKTSTTQAATTTPHSTSTTSTTGATTSTTGATTSTAATTMSTPRVATTTELPCEDIEQGGFKCSFYDALHFCTDTGSAFYMISHERCRKHCGFCTQGMTTPGSYLQNPNTVTAISQLKL